MHKLIIHTMCSTDTLCYIRLPSLHHHHQIRLGFCGGREVGGRDYILQDQEVSYLSIPQNTKLRDR